jgi:tripartite-type tricarboxylate transporter receptor subunit TctC
VRIVVPSAPGAILDLVARVIGPAMGEAMGQSVVVDNRPGAGTNIGMEVVARAPGDGYTLLVASNGLTVNPGMYAKLPFDVKKDFAPSARAPAHHISSWCILRCR